METRELFKYLLSRDFNVKRRLGCGRIIVPIGEIKTIDVWMGGDGLVLITESKDKYTPVIREVDFSDFTVDIDRCLKESYNILKELRWGFYLEFQKELNKVYQGIKTEVVVLPDNKITVRLTLGKGRCIIYLDDLTSDKPFVILGSSVVESDDIQEIIKKWRGT